MVELSGPEDLLRAWPQLQKVEHRMRVLDYLAPLTLIATAALNHGNGWLGEAVILGLGFTLGAVVLRAALRRRHFEEMRRNVELLGMTIAAYKTAEAEGEGWRCARCGALHVGDFGGICQHCGEQR